MTHLAVRAWTKSNDNVTLHTERNWSGSFPAPATTANQGEDWGQKGLKVPGLVQSEPREVHFSKCEAREIGFGIQCIMEKVNTL